MNGDPHHNLDPYAAFRSFVRDGLRVDPVSTCTSMNLELFDRSMFPILECMSSVCRGGTVGARDMTAPLQETDPAGYGRHGGPGPYIYKLGTFLVSAVLWMPRNGLWDGREGEICYSRSALGGFLLDCTSVGSDGSVLTFYCTGAETDLGAVLARISFRRVRLRCLRIPLR